MADYLGLNPETVSRILGRIKAAQLVTFISPTELLVPESRRRCRIKRRLGRLSAAKLLGGRERAQVRNCVKS